jgi:hypothetical protein
MGVSVRSAVPVVPARAALSEAEADQLREGRRFIPLGYGGFRADHQAARGLIDRRKVSHEYRDGPARTHDRHGGWVAGAAGLLLAAPGGRR